MTTYLVPELDAPGRFQVVAYRVMVDSPSGVRLIRRQLQVAKPFKSNEFTRVRPSD